MKNIFKYIFILLFIFCSYSVFYSQNKPNKPIPVSFDGNNENKQIYSSEDSIKSLTAFREEINSLLNDKNLKGANYGIAIYSQESQKFIYQRNVEKLLTPASNTKLFTTFAAMSFLGPNFDIKTSVYCYPNDLNDNIINGDIYLYGRGDINLSINDMELLAEDIKNLGIERITGNIFADPTFFDRDFERSSYSGDNEVVEATGPVFALSIENNLINVLVKASSKIGSKANVQIIPFSHSFEVRNTSKVGNVVRTKKRKGKKATSNALTVSMKAEGDKAIFYINGTISPNQTENYSYYNKTPEITTAGVLKERLEVMGIKVDGNVKIGQCKELKSGGMLEIASCTNPLYSIMYEVNKKSNNYLAEMVFKIIGGNYRKYEVTAKSAREKIMQVLDSNYIPHKGFMLNDGCGLSRRNLVTADGLSKLLIMNRKKKWGKAFDSTFAIAGVDGTLRKRMLTTSAENNLRGKTGTLRNVSSLAGYVGTKNRDEFIFAFIFNGPSPGYYKQIENKLGELMANFQYYKY